MNKNIEELSDILSRDKELVKEIMLKNSIREMYEVCQKYVKGYTENEFEDYINAAMDEAEGAIVKMKSEEEKLANVSGGRILKSTMEFSNPIVSYTISQASKYKDKSLNLKDNVAD